MNEASGEESGISHAGDVLDALRSTYPRISGLLHRADQARTLTLSLLRSDASGALDAIEATSRFLHGMDDWVRKVPAPLAAEFVARITSDFLDGIDGTLEHKVSAVLDPSRDLMELSVLFREFRLRPKSFDTSLVLGRPARSGGAIGGKSIPTSSTAWPRSTMSTS